MTLALWRGDSEEREYLILKQVKEILDGRRGVMFIVVTKGELVKAGQWDEFCTIVGVDKGVDTGSASNAPVFLTEEEAEKTRDYYSKKV